MKIAYIMRGVPGSGKSTLARKLVNGNGAIHSTDDFFVKDGEYQFDPTRLREFHDLNFKAFCRSLEANIPVVVCDNTNSRRWQFKRYVEAAEKAGYLTAFVIIPHPDPKVASQRTTHGVPLRTIQRMIAEWEA